MKNSNKSADKIKSLIDAFDHLGQQLNKYANHEAANPEVDAILDEATQVAKVQNPWFTKDNMNTAVVNWAASVAERCTHQLDFGLSTSKME